MTSLPWRTSLQDRQFHALSMLGKTINVFLWRTLHSALSSGLALSEPVEMSVVQAVFLIPHRPARAYPIWISYRWFRTLWVHVHCYGQCSLVAWSQNGDNTCVSQDLNSPPGY